MSETPENKPSATRPPRKQKPRAPANSGGTANGQSNANAGQNGAQNRNGQGANPRRRPAQKPRRPQNQARSPRTADNIGNTASQPNRRPQNSGRPQANNRNQGQGQNRNGNNSNYRSADPFGDDQFRGSDWYREDQARFAKQQIAFERAEAAGKTNDGGNSSNSPNQRNPRNRNARRARPVTNNNESNNDDTTDSVETAAPQEQNAADNTQPDNIETASDAADPKAVGGKREGEKSRRAPWRTQKHATARKTTKTDAPPKSDDAS